LRYTGKLLDLENERDTQDVIKATVKEVDRTINTTVGRVIFNQSLPPEMPYINGMLKKKGLTSLVNYCFLRLGHETTVQALDKLKELGFTYATRAACPSALTIWSRRRTNRNSCATPRRGHQGRAAVQGRRHHQRRTLQQGRRHLVGDDRARRRRDVQGDAAPRERLARAQPDSGHGRFGRAW
jgi:hypothetical protein